MGSRVQLYPPAPGAEPSASYRATVEGRPAFVEGQLGASTLRFAFAGRVVVLIAVAGAVGDWRVFPEPSVAAAGPTATGLRIELVEPGPVVVWIGDREPLFVLADPPSDAPIPDGDAVVAVDPAPTGVRTGDLQAALDHAAGRRDGGTVLLPPGRYRTGTLVLRSGVRLHLAAGALLEGLDDPSAYPVDDGRPESGRDETLAADARYLGRTMTFSRLLLVDQAVGVRIEGRGTIAGSGGILRTVHGAVPNLIRVRSSEDVVIEDVLLRDAAAWTVHVVASRDVAIDNVKVLNDRSVLNTDGVDIDMSSNVRVDRAFVSTKDDAVCVKATRNGGLAGDVRNVHVTRSVVSSRDAGLKIGSETDADRMSDVRFEDCWVFDSGRAMSVVVRDGAVVERVAFRRIGIGPRVGHLVEQAIGVRDPDARYGVIRGLAFEDVSAPEYEPPGSAWTWYAQFRPGRPAEGADVPVFAGADEAHAVVGLRLRNVVVRGRRLTSAPVAREVAGLTIGDHVRGVEIG